MPAPSRRRILQTIGSASFAGFVGHPQLFGDEYDEPERRAPDWCIDEFDEPVPEVEETAESIDGIERDEDELNSRHEVGYQCHPQGYQLCANCRYFIPSQTTEPIGACAIVDGRVRSQDWCGLYEYTEQWLDEMPDPNPLDL